MDALDYLVSNHWWYVLNVVGVISEVLLLLFMHYSAKHRNHKLSAGWYICGVLIPFVTFFVFLSQRKKFPGPETKVCYQCENRFPETFVMCNRCLIELPEIDREENKKNDKFAKGFLWGYVVTTVVYTVVCVVLISVVASAITDDLSSLTSSNRIGVQNEEGETIYYDRLGNSYTDPYEVKIYDEEGNEYNYITEPGEYFDETYYVSSDGKKYISYECYVDTKGNFFHDKNGEVWCEFEEDEESEAVQQTEGYGDETFSEVAEGAFSAIMDDIYNYKYYEDVLTDGKGNYYYWAEDASWNEKGELITAENDPSLLTTEAE